MSTEPLPPPPYSSSMAATHAAGKIYSTSRRASSASSDDTASLRSTESLVEGMEDKDLHVMQRSLYKKVQHVRILSATNPNSTLPLDLETSEVNAWDPDLLRFNVERFYSTVIVGFRRLGHEVGRLRAWSEEDGLRTITWFATYWTAWWYHLTLVAFISLIAVLIVVPESRVYLFPPEDSAPGGSRTQAESAEEDAAEFAGNVDGLVKEAAAGQREAPAFDPTAAPVPPTEEDERTKKAAQRNKAGLAKIGRPIQQLFGNLADVWERWANLLAPTSPFETQKGRVRVALVVTVPVTVLSFIVSGYLVSRGVGLLVGLWFFGEPIFRKLPPLPPLPDPRRTLLAGVPTNAQLTLRLMRDAEARCDHLPAPPFFERATQQDDTGDSGDKAAKGKTDAPSRMAVFVKATGRMRENTAGLVSGTQKVDWRQFSEKSLSRLNIAPESPAARRLLARMPSRERPAYSSFLVNHRGRPGHILVFPPDLDTGTPARVVFNTMSASAEENGDVDQPKKGKLTLDGSDIVELRKRGFSFAGRLFFSAALGLEDAGGTSLDITVRRKKVVKQTVVEVEEVLRFGGVPRRDELFARLLAIGSQRWEIL